MDKQERIENESNQQIAINQYLHFERKYKKGTNDKAKARYLGKALEYALALGEY